jgi:hypothetical protein
MGAVLLDGADWQHKHAAFSGLRDLIPGEVAQIHLSIAIYVSVQN